MLPPLVDYYGGLTAPIIAAMAVGGALVAATIAIFYANLGSVLKNVPKKFKSKTVFLLSVYQIVSICQFIVILVPRSVALAESVSILSFGFGSLVYHSLLLDYVGGETVLIKKSQPGAFSIKVRPCCLLPFTTPGDLTKNKLLVIRMMILQFPIAHGLIYVFYNIRWIEDPAGSNLYFLPFMLASIIAVVWGLNLLTSVVAPVLPDHGIPGKYLVLQLVLLMCKLQPAIGDLIYLAEGVQSIPVEAPMTVSVYKNVIICTIILIQMIVLSVFAQRCYRTPKRDDLREAMANGQTTIAVIS